jgi:hypothetical protein
LVSIRGSLIIVAVAVAITACSIGALVLVEDGLLAGLDRFGEVDSELDGANVAACNGVELASPVQVVTARLQPTTLACTKDCTDECGSGHTVKFFVDICRAA